MKVSRENRLLEYKEECFKQTMPYGYELAFARDDTSEDIKNAPTGRIIRFPDDSGNILNFEGINEDYVIFADRDGVFEPDLIKRLLGNGNGADIVYCDEDYVTDINADLDDINARIRTLRTP